jgi:soluble lytic murein transglycosylase-like protein
LQYPPRFRACEPYRDKIASAVRKHWGVFQFSDAWAAQLYQESLCNPLARSHVGAAGLAQFMPRTWIEVAAQLNLPPGSTPHEDIAIDAGAYYMARMMRTWSSPRPDFERTRLAQASYNAGAGNIINAQRACNGARDWRNIETCLHLITGRNAEETRTYVERIERWWLAMFGCEPFAAPRDLQAEWGC